MMYISQCLCAFNNSYIRPQIKLILFMYIFLYISLTYFSILLVYLFMENIMENMVKILIETNLDFLYNYYNY